MPVNLLSGDCYSRVMAQVNNIRLYHVYFRIYLCKGVDCSTISHTVYTMYCRHQYGWYSV